MPPFVSVVMPYRDAAETIEEAIDSVLGQRGRFALELIAIDDGSSDAGPALVGRAASRHRALLAVASPDRGIVAAIQTGLRASAPGASWIARMDADDVCLPDRFTHQLDRIARDPRLGAVGTLVEAFPRDGVGEGLARYVAWLNGIVTPEDHAREIFVESPLCHPSVLMRRDALEHAGGYRDVDWPEDYDLWLRMHSAGYGLAKVPELLVRWRHHADRASFRDPRYSLERLRRAKAAYLAPDLRRMDRPIAIWGAGPTGRRLARALEVHGVRADTFVDIDPRKVGRVARGARIVAPGALVRGAHTIVVAVGARGARDLVRSHLDERGFVEGVDYVAAA